MAQSTRRPRSAAGSSAAPSTKPPATRSAVARVERLEYRLDALEAKLAQILEAKLGDVASGQVDRLEDLLTVLATEVRSFASEIGTRNDAIDSIATEVRTRRLVVVNDKGEEMITAENEGHFSTLMVRAPGVAEDDADAVVFLQADNESGAGVFLSVSGNVVGDFSAAAGHLPTVAVLAQGGRRQGATGLGLQSQRLEIYHWQHRDTV